MMGFSKPKVTHGGQQVWGPPQHLCRPWLGHPYLMFLLRPKKWQIGWNCPISLLQPLKT